MILGLEYVVTLSEAIRLYIMAAFVIIILVMLVIYGLYVAWIVLTNRISRAFRKQQILNSKSRTTNT